MAASLVALVAIGSVGMVAMRVITRQREALTTLTTLSHTQRILQDADMQHDTVRADVMSGLVASQRDADTAVAMRARVGRGVARYRELLAAAQSMPIGEELQKSIAAVQPDLTAYLAQADELARHALDERAAAIADIPTFEASFERLAHANEQLTNVFSMRVVEADQHAAAVAQTGLWLIGLTCMVAALVVGIVGRLVGRSVGRGLGRVRGAAQAIANGDLSIRTDPMVNDDVGAVASAVNQMADTLQTMISRLQTEQEQDAFSRQLSEVLDMADTEVDTYEVVSRGMAAISQDMAMELLVADSSRAHLERATIHPGCGPSNCTVESPYGCMAVRRGNPITFESSEALNACVRLRDRDEGPVSAVCVPLSFMGRSLGVLHATGPSGQAVHPRIVSQLTTLGILAGSRIGTVRAFERTQVQASTDVLTGLLNRRSLESRVRRFSLSPYGVVLADLDHFKRLNDTLGHDAGDRALKMFADVVKRSVRERDHAARWGGEEFMIVLEGRDATAGVEVVERIRTNLAAACQGGKGVPTVTASFGIADTTMGNAFEQIIRIADDALYQSKEKGRDRGTVGDPRRVQGAVPRRDAEHLASIAVDELTASQVGLQPELV